MVLVAQQSGPLTLKGSDRAPNGAKKIMLPVLTREEASLTNYDFGLCSNQIELQSKEWM